MGNSPSSAKGNKVLMAIIDTCSKTMGSPHWRRNSGLHRTSTNKKQSQDQLSPYLSEILALVEDLKRDREGRALLDAFIKAQATESSTDETDLILELLDLEETIPESFPISEIYIGRAA